MTNRIYGYARVSTRDQNLNLQQDALKKYGCEIIFEEKKSGVKEDREELANLLTQISKGDTLVVYKLDRLGRSLSHLLKLSQQLQERKIKLVSLSENLDTSTPIGRMFFSIMGAVAELERENIIERVKAGVKAAKVRGTKFGRRSLLTPEIKEEIEMRFLSGQGIHEVMKATGFGQAIIYRWAKQGKIKGTNFRCRRTKKEMEALRLSTQTG